jgi:hypothetical protein
MSLRSRIERLPPYPSLLLLSIPTLVVECTKLVAFVVAGEGHWLTGMTFLICAYGASAMGTERLFKIVKPKLLKLPWFAHLWGYISRSYARLRDWLGTTMAGATSKSRRKCRKER